MYEWALRVKYTAKLVVKASANQTIDNYTWLHQTDVARTVPIVSRPNALHCVSKNGPRTLCRITLTKLEHYEWNLAQLIVIHNQTRQPALIFPTSQPNATFFGGGVRGMRTQGAMTPKFELGRDFCTMHLPPSFIILCLLVRKSSCWQTNKQTNRRRWKHPTLFATLRFTE